MTDSDSHKDIGIDSNTLFAFLKTINCHSEKDILNIILELFRKNPKCLDMKRQDEVVAFYKDCIQQKAEASKNIKTRRSQAEKTKKLDRVAVPWIYKDKSDYESNCHACGHPYYKGNPVFVRRSDNKGFHTQCTPDEIKDNQPFYQAALKKEQAQ